MVEWESLLPKSLAIAFCGYGLAFLIILFGGLGIIVSLSLLTFTTAFLKQGADDFYKKQNESYADRLRGWSSYKEEYPELLKKYELEIEGLKADHRMKHKLYKQQCENLKAESRSPEAIQEYRKENLSNLLKDTHDDGENYQSKEGRHEKTLKKELDVYFPGKTFTHKALLIPGCERPFTSDIAYIDSDINLYIDIEVDEPYVLSSEEPIHYIGWIKDVNRNDFFLNRNWVVVRFSEEQVVCHTLSCCKFIAEIITDLTGDSTTLERLSDVADLPPMPQWSREQAEEMASIKYRDKYARLPRCVSPKPRLLRRES
ncbi:hypothetical protein VB780_30555 [Leptolyngbya sp. CCNP1308]|uniref:hypothetical protein n=1 Tax=Leptolyngbya sp. CCNP1308 TaxID=3110255 RepID=UPI002B20D645|nr:hypothetical protein [Leptolyngbya sp. CCNP1308]MEA5452952.1 hypothetical protein [Leptolyngbya sp. CCNP1308]